MLLTFLRSVYKPPWIDIVSCYDWHQVPNSTFVHKNIIISLQNMQNVISHQEFDCFLLHRCTVQVENVKKKYCPNFPFVFLSLLFFTFVLPVYFLSGYLRIVCSVWVVSWTLLTKSAQRRYTESDNVWNLLDWRKHYTAKKQEASAIVTFKSSAYDARLLCKTF